MDKKLMDKLKSMKDADQLFDLICMRNYMAGDLGAKIPVDESRELFERVKELLADHE